MLLLSSAHAQENRYEFLAKTVKQNKNIDDECNAQAADGWQPLYVFEEDTTLLSDEPQYKLLFSR